MVPAGDSNAFDASMRMTRACTEVAAQPTAHLPDEALCADDVLRAAVGEKLYQEVKVVPK